MLGRIVYEQGRKHIRMEQFGPLTVMTAILVRPQGIWGEKRLRWAERLLRRKGVSRVILPAGFSERNRLRMLRPVEVLPLYRAHADVLVQEALRVLGIVERHAVVALHGGRMSQELYGTACRLCPLVRSVCIRVPGEGDWWADRLLTQYGVPSLPAEMACLTVAFSPTSGGVGRVLPLYEQNLEGLGLRLWAEGLEAPADCADGLLAALWEQGCLDRQRLRADLTLPLDKWGESTYNSME